MSHQFIYYGSTLSTHHNQSLQHRAVNFSLRAHFSFNFGSYWFFATVTPPSEAPSVNSNPNTNLYTFTNQMQLFQCVLNNLFHNLNLLIFHHSFSISLLDQAVPVSWRPTLPLAIHGAPHVNSPLQDFPLISL